VDACLPPAAAAERITAAYELDSHTDIVTHLPRHAASAPAAA
jgi:hypothetical protein